jgi:metallo-beta-lactamase class B
MKNRSGLKLYAGLICATALAQAPSPGRGGPPDPNRYPWPNHPVVVFAGETFTPRSISARNDGNREDGRTALPPHKIIDNIYWVGTLTLSSFLIVTPQGNILLNSTYEENVKPVIQKSVEQLGFRFSDIKILIGNHAHGDHQEGDALVKELTGAQVESMAEDVPLLKTIMPGGKPHPIDRIFHDGDTISLGGTTLVAHLTPGHTHGGTTYTMKATEGGRSYDVVFFTSLRTRGADPHPGPGDRLTPDVLEEFNRSFKFVKTLPCDVPLGDHTEEFNIREKYAKLKSGGPNPYIDPGNCKTEAHLQEAMLHAILSDGQFLASELGLKLP